MLVRAFPTSNYSVKRTPVTRFRSFKPCGRRRLPQALALMARLLAFLMLLSAMAPCGAKPPTRPPLPAGAEVQSLAEHYITSLPKSTPPSQLEQARNAFKFAFLMGFTNSEGAIGSDNDAITKGFKAGQTYRHRHPHELAHVMAGFGYKPMTMRGIWHTGPELSVFCPANNPKAYWWLTILGNSPAAKGHISPEQCTDVQISGFLSPAGQYGHMGGFSREVYADSIMCLRANNSVNRTQIPLRGFCAGYLGR